MSNEQKLNEQRPDVSTENPFCYTKIHDEPFSKNTRRDRDDLLGAPYGRGP